MAILEISKKLSKKERFLKWWKIEGKIECAAAIVVLVVIIVFWNSLFVQAIIAFTAAVWCLGKIYFRRDKWAVLAMTAVWAFSQGMALLREYMKS